VVRHLEAIEPFGLALEVQRLSTGNGFVANTAGTAYEAARASLRRAWGSDPIEIGSGGAIPLVSSLHAAAPEAEVLMFGAEDMQSNLHAPNERLVIEEFRKTVVAIVDFLHRYGSLGNR
jgi:acetylornithine deacetylase/succinyl-diaminopimelate desuccinylase-like protein